MQDRAARFTNTTALRQVSFLSAVGCRVLSQQEGFSFISEAG